MASTNQNLDVVLRVNTTGFRTAMAEASRLATQNLKTLRAEAERTAAALARVHAAPEGATGKAATKAKANVGGDVLGSGLKELGSGLLTAAGGPWGIAIASVQKLGEAYLDMVKASERARSEYKEQMQSLQQMSFSMDQAGLGMGAGTLPLEQAVATLHEQARRCASWRHARRRCRARSSIGKAE